MSVVHSIVENIIVKTSLEIGKREFDSILYLVLLSTYSFIPLPVLTIVLHILDKDENTHTVQCLGIMTNITL